jgi:hypothetical protein
MVHIKAILYLEADFRISLPDCNSMKMYMTQLLGSSPPRARLRLRAIQRANSHANRYHHLQNVDVTKCKYFCRLIIIQNRVWTATVFNGTGGLIMVIYLFAFEFLN